MEHRGGKSPKIKLFKKCPKPLVVCGSCSYRDRLWNRTHAAFICKFKGAGCQWDKQCQ